MILKFLSFVSFCFLLPGFVLVKAQDKNEFEIVTILPYTSVKDQQNTGACWCYATCSFLESELIRMGKGEFDLSEGYIFRKVYEIKAYNYILREGKANMAQGGLAHDVLRALDRFGMVPEDIYSGKYIVDSVNDYSEIDSTLIYFCNTVVDKRKVENWRKTFVATIDSFLLPVPQEFNYQHKSFTSLGFMNFLEINTNDYVALTSYQHHPFYNDFILEVPDNFDNGFFYNLPIDELEKIVDSSIMRGYSIVWDGDVSEKTFFVKRGIAILPKVPVSASTLKLPVDEISVSQDMRQETFENFETTEDHLMHLIGIAKDSAGNKFYIIKNSWGNTGAYSGLIYMSKAYFRLKTVAVTLNKAVLPFTYKHK